MKMETCVALLTLAVLVTVVLSELEICISEDNLDTLDCQEGFTISITNARYGSSNGSMCPWISSCFEDTSQIVRQSCDGLTSCNVLPNNIAFGDPCPGTLKYLGIRYLCKKTKQNGVRRSVTCESETSTLSCPIGERLVIVSANFGRTDSLTCFPISMHTTDCVSLTAVDKIKDFCQGKQTCLLDASNSVFGDPCPGVTKYIDSNYICAARPTVINLSPQSYR